MCKNAEYGFELKRKDGLSAWALVKYHPIGELPPRYGAAEERRKRSGPFWIDNRWLPELVSDKGFSIKDVSFANHDGLETVRVEFKYAPASSSESPIRDGWFQLDCARQWSVLCYEARADFGRGTHGTITGRNEFPESRSVNPEMWTYSRRIRAIYADGRRIDDEIVNEYLYETTPVPESEFTLSAFNLPEPVGHQKVSVPNYIWLLIAATLCALGVIVIRLTARMRSRYPDT